MSMTSIGHVSVGPNTMKITTCQSFTLPYTTVSLTYSYVCFGVGKGSIYFLSRFFCYGLRVDAYVSPPIKKRPNRIESAISTQKMAVEFADAVPTVVASVVVAVAVVALLVPGDPLHVPPGQHPASQPY
jgi:hypothetical protein